MYDKFYRHTIIIERHKFTSTLITMLSDIAIMYPASSQEVVTDCPAHMCSDDNNEKKLRKSLDRVNEAEQKRVFFLRK